MSTHVPAARNRHTPQNAPSVASAPTVVQETIRAPGAPLAAPVRARFEQRLGHSLDTVRIHTDPRASDSARAVHARAYNVGPNVVFGAGEFAPETEGGARLLAHELTHVIQQRGRGPGEPSSAAEHEADDVARQLTGSAPLVIRAGTHTQALQRAPADDKEIDDILKSAKRAASAKAGDPTATEPVFRLIARYLPQWEKRVSGASFSDKVKRINSQASGTGGTNIDIKVGREFLADIKDARMLRPLAAEIEQSFIATKVLPDDLDLSNVTAAGSPSRGVRTVGVAVKPDVIKEIGKQDYWSAKVFSRFFVIMVNGVDTARFDKDAEERDAVFSVLWSQQPAKFDSVVTRVFAIPQRPAPKGQTNKTKPLLYKIEYSPIGPKSGGKPQVSIDFIAADKAATVTTSTTPPASFSKQNIGLKFVGFPGNDIKAYWKAQPEEERHVFHFMQSLAPNPFDQVLEVNTQTGGRTPTTRTTFFKVSGKRDQANDLQDVRIERLARPISQAAAPADYRQKTDAGDFELEQQQVKTTDKLGSVDVPRDISAAEASQVKWLVASYFEKGTRNEEVDVRLAGDSGEVLYTFRFLAKNDVQVIRVGEPKKGSQLDPDRLDAGRSADFLKLYKAKDIAGLTTYVSRRYPGAKAAGKTVADLRADLNAKINADADTDAWLKSNYDLTVLDATAASKRMKEVHGLENPQLAGMKAFATGERRLVEQALEPFSLPVLAKLKGTQLARQATLIEKTRTGYVRKPKTAGEMTSVGTQRTVRIFDQLNVNSDTLFAGGRLGTMRTESATIAHEFGHVVALTDDTKKKFNEFVAKENIKPITSYAESNPSSEFFPEAFSYFNSDPEWMKVNQPKLFAWFETLHRTGKPP